MTAVPGRSPGRELTAKAACSHPVGHRDFGPGKNDPLHNPNLLRMVIQGIDWVATGN